MTLQIFNEQSQYREMEIFTLLVTQESVNFSENLLY